MNHPTELESEPVLNGAIPCTFCHRDVLIPVHFKCFPCESRSTPGQGPKRSCGEGYCVCLHCAREYLQLNKPRNQRDFEKICPMCRDVNSKVNPRNLGSADRCYSKNRIYMRLDPKVHSCVHSDKGCPYQGKQCDMERHLWDSCDYRSVSCCCGSFFMAKDRQLHSATCNQCRECPVCLHHVPHLDFYLHLRESHNLIPCTNVGCKEMKTTDQIDTHRLHTCAYRSIHCFFCDRKSLFSEHAKHLSEHIKTSQVRLEETMEDCLKAQKQLRAVSKAFTNFLKENS